LYDPLHTHELLQVTWGIDCHVGAHSPKHILAQPQMHTFLDVLISRLMRLCMGYCG